MIKLRSDVDIHSLVNAVIYVVMEKSSGYLKTEEEILFEIESALEDKIEAENIENIEVEDLAHSKVFTEFLDSIFHMKDTDYNKMFIFQLVNEINKRQENNHWGDSFGAFRRELNFVSFQNELIESMKVENFFDEYKYLYTSFLKMLPKENAFEVMKEFGVADEEYLKGNLHENDIKTLLTFIHEDFFSEEEKSKIIKVLGNNVKFGTIIQVLENFENPENILYALQYNFTNEKREYIRTASYTKIYDSVFKSTYNDMGLKANVLDNSNLYPEDIKMKMMYVLNYVLNARSLDDRDNIGGPTFCEKFQEDYYRMLLSRVLYYRDTMNNDDIPEYVYSQMEYYEKIKKELSEVNSDEERKNIILLQDDNLLKQALLEMVEAKEYRAEIINSIDNEVDSELKEYVDLAQRMIVDFFEQTCGEQFTADKREILNLVLARTNVEYTNEEVGTNGSHNAEIHKISLNKTIRNEPQTVLSFLIHEYGHALSRRNFFIGHNDFIHDLDEGFADVFSDSVINNYLKDNEISINGKKISFEKPQIYQSSYYVPNGKIRTLLYALEKEGKNIYPIIQEYFLGDKFETLGHFFSQEKAQEIDADFCGEPRLFNISFGDIYGAHEEALKNIDENNYWCQNNYLIAEILIENVLEQNGSADSFLDLRSDEAFNGNFIYSFFMGREVYEITGEEIERYLSLVNKVDCLGNKVITKDYSGFLRKIEGLDIETIKANSLGILDTMSGAIDMHKEFVDEHFTRIIAECINTEVEMPEKDKTVDIELKLYSLYNKLQKKLLSKNSDSCQRNAMKYINVGIGNVLDTLQDLINKGSASEIKDYIEQSESEYLLDARLETFLKENNIEFEKALKDKNQTEEKNSEFFEKSMEQQVGESAETKSNMQEDVIQNTILQMSDKLLADILRSAISQGISLDECVKMIAQNPEIVGNNTQKDIAER